MTRTMSSSELVKRMYEQLLSQTNVLKFRCDNCGEEFKIEQPEGKWVRYNQKTNFFIPRNNENGTRTPIHCPSCQKTNGIRRLSLWFSSQERKRDDSRPQRKREEPKWYDEE